jgi:putative membrane protein
MNRRILLRSAGFTAMGLSLAGNVSAKDDAKVGKLEPAEFKKINSEAGAKVKALKADATALSDVDKALAGEIALGGMMQLQASELALKKIGSADVKLIAEAEVEEQKELAAKLKEFAAAKDIKLPDKLDEEGRQLLEELREAGSADRTYLEKSGVKGHEELKRTMMKVSKEAKDPMLKALAETALPLIEVHLAVSKDEVATMS